MRTYLDLILNQAEVTLEGAKLTVKDFVLQEDDTAKCIRTKKYFSIRSGAKRLGKGLTSEIAWENAAINILET